MSYIWTDSNQTNLKYVDEENTKIVFFSTDPANRHYAEYLASSETAAPYVDPTVIDGIEDLTQAKTVASDSVRSEAYSRLLPTDWVVIRETETGTPAPADTTAYRAAVRTASADKVAAIEGKQELSALADYLRSAEFAAWPEASAS